MNLHALPPLTLSAHLVLGLDEDLFTPKPTTKPVADGPFPGTYPPCDRTLFNRIVNASSDGSRCLWLTGYAPWKLAIPTGDQLKAVCRNAECTAFFKEMAAAFPTDCESSDFVNVHALYTTKYPAACAATSTDAEPSITPVPAPTPTSTTLAQCAAQPIVLAATGENAWACKRETTYEPTSLSVPSGNLLRSVCLNAACSKFLSEMRAAVPSDCQFIEKPIRSIYVEQFPAACAEAITDPEPTTPAPTPAPDQTTPSPNPIPQCDFIKLATALLGSNARSCGKATSYVLAPLKLPEGDVLKAVCQNAQCEAYVAEASALLPSECTILDVPARAFFVEKFPAACAEAIPTPEPTTSAPTEPPSPTPQQTTPSPDPILECDLAKLIPALAGTNAQSCGRATSYVLAPLKLPEGDVLKAFCQNAQCQAYVAEASALLRSECTVLGVPARAFFVKQVPAACAVAIGPIPTA